MHFSLSFVTYSEFVPVNTVGWFNLSFFFFFTILCGEEVAGRSPSLSLFPFFTAAAER